MKEINRAVFDFLKAGDLIVEIDGDKVIYWEYLMIHPNNNDYVLMIDNLSKDAKKIYIPTFIGGDFYTDYTFKEIYQKEIEYLEDKIKRLQQRIQREEVKEVEKQGEKKSVEDVEQVDNLHQYLYGNDEQKPIEWSDEDEEISAAIIKRITGESNALSVSLSSAIGWIRKVKDRVIPLPKEWSEEDEKFFKTALWHISYSISNGKSTDIHCDTTDWFKSIKERFTWKPSDEQMDTLKQWLKDKRYDGDARHCFPIFDSLYQDLKKLKEK